MAMLEIVKYPNQILLSKAKPVEKIDDTIQKLIDDMLETMYSAPGIGLAANQVGVPLRIIVMDITKSVNEKKPIVIINPEIKTVNGERVDEEGCLSVPDFRTNIKRSTKLIVEGLNRLGEKVLIEASDLLASAVQHEVDHINGITILDRASPIKRRLYKDSLRKKIKTG